MELTIDSKPCDLAGEPSPSGVTPPRNSRTWKPHGKAGRRSSRSPRRPVTKRFWDSPATRIPQGGSTPRSTGLCSRPKGRSCWPGRYGCSKLRARGTGSKSAKAVPAGRKMPPADARRPGHRLSCAPAPVDRLGQLDGRFARKVFPDPPRRIPATEQPVGSAAGRKDPLGGRLPSLPARGDARRDDLRRSPATASKAISRAVRSSARFT